jgi:hypothetical protein
MATTQLMRSAAERMEQAEKKLREVRESSFTPSALKEWLETLTDYVLAMAEVQEYGQQSVHEKLQAMGRQLHRPLPPGPKRRAS